MSKATMQDQDEQIDGHGGGSWWRRALKLRRGEGVVVARAALLFFLLLCSYYILRPIRGAIATAEVRDLEWLYLGTLCGMLIANPLFAALVTNWPRRKFIPATYRFFALNLIVFFVILWLWPAQRETRIAFYIWLSVFNLFIVSVFWALMADIFRTGQSKRLFGYIGAAGTVGAVTGAMIVRWIGDLVTSGVLSQRSLFALLLVAALLLEIAVWVSTWVMRSADDDVAEQPAAGSGSAPAPRRSIMQRISELLAGITLIARSPYLAGICLFLFLYSFTSTIIDFQLNTLLEGEFETDAARAQVWARLDLWVNGIALVTQLLLTGRIMMRLGVGFTLATLPIVTCAGFVVIAMIQRGVWSTELNTIAGLSPALFALAAVYVLRRATNFALARPARETLYTVVGRDAKYKAKSLIDTFIYRGGDQIGAFGFVWMSARWTLGRISLTMIPLAAAWIALALVLGLAQRVLLRRSDADQSQHQA